MNLPSAQAAIRRAAPRVTVVTPVHNDAAHLREALDSIARQTFADWELVVVDDASEDDSYAVATEFAATLPDRVKVLRLDRNVGPATARNRGIAASAGSQFIALLDSDDLWMERYLEHQVAAFDEALMARRPVGIAACNALVETPAGTAGTFAEVFGWRDVVTYDDMLERSYIMVSALFSRQAFEEVGGFAAECWGSEDYDLWLRIMEAGYEVVTTREPLAVYRHHPEGLSKDPVKLADAGIAAYGRALVRNAMTPRQRRKAKAGLRHYRALRERALLAAAWRDRRVTQAVVVGVRAASWGAIAFLQAPERWGEWLRGATRSVRRRLRK